MIQKVLAFCLRKRNDKFEILVLQKLNRKSYNIEVPGGTVEANELLEDAVRRELMEETGISEIIKLEEVKVVPFFADWRNEWQERNIFLLELGKNNSDEWIYKISDGEEDKGLQAKVFWTSIENAKEKLMWGQGQFIDEIIDKYED